MKRPYGKALAIARLSLIGIIPYNQCTADMIDGTSRGFSEAITRIYEQNAAKFKELKDFWSNPDLRIREFVLRGHEGGVRGIDRR